MLRELRNTQQVVRFGRQTRPPERGDGSTLEVEIDFLTVESWQRHAPKLLARTILTGHTRWCLERILKAHIVQSLLRYFPYSAARSLLVDRRTAGAKINFTTVNEAQQCATMNVEFSNDVVSVVGLCVGKEYCGRSSLLVVNQRRVPGEGCRRSSIQSWQASEWPALTTHAQ
jgi:hypothetical protein